MDADGKRVLNFPRMQAVIDGATIPFRFTLLFSVNSTDDARLAVYVIPTDEELLIARDTVRAVQPPS